jgi:hypothetical protein
LGIVSIKTYRRWLREERGGRQPGKVGWPRLTASLRELILGLARENAGWGVRCIFGEFKKPPVKVSRSFVRRVLANEKIVSDRIATLRVTSLSLDAASSPPSQYAELVEQYPQVKE